MGKDAYGQELKVMGYKSMTHACAQPLHLQTRATCVCVCVSVSVLVCLYLCVWMYVCDFVSACPTHTPLHSPSRSVFSPALAAASYIESCPHCQHTLTPNL